MNFLDDQIETNCGHLHIVSNCDQDTDSDYRYRLSQHIVGVLSVIGTKWLVVFVVVCVDPCTAKPGCILYINSEDPDQMTSDEDIRSGSALFLIQPQNPLW